MKGNGGFKVFDLLAECVSQARQSSHVKASSPVQSLDMTGRNQVRIGSAHHFDLVHRSYFRRTVAAFLMVLATVNAIALDDHAEVRAHAESVLNGLNVGA